MKVTLIGWSFSSRTREPEVDSVLVVEAYTPEFVKTAIQLSPDSQVAQEISDTAHKLNAFFLRCRYGVLNVIKLDDLELSFEECQNLIKTLPRERLIQLSKGWTEL